MNPYIWLAVALLAFITIAWLGHRRYGYQSREQERFEHTLKGVERDSLHYARQLIDNRMEWKLRARACGMEDRFQDGLNHAHEIEALSWALNKVWPLSTSWFAARWDQPEEKIDIGVEFIRATDQPSYNGWVESSLENELGITAAQIRLEIGFYLSTHLSSLLQEGEVEEAVRLWRKITAGGAHHSDWRELRGQIELPEGWNDRVADCIESPLLSDFVGQFSDFMPCEFALYAKAVALNPDRTLVEVKHCLALCEAQPRLMEAITDAVRDFFLTVVVSYHSHVEAG